MYMITTQSDSYIPMTCWRLNDEPDVVIFWENSREAEEINNIGPEETVILAIEDKTTAELIKKILMKNGHSSESIIDFYAVFNALIPFMKADRVMKDPSYPKYKGMILGLSHPEVGIIQDNLKVPLANLSVSSQDLYYSLCTFLYVMEKYPDRFESLDYLVLDMYQYNYFNFDTSLSMQALAYWLSFGGISFDEHNYHMNKNHNASFEDVTRTLTVRQYLGLNETMVKKCDEYFDFGINPQLRERYYKNWKDLYLRSQIVTDEIIDNFNYAPTNVVKRFDETIRDNTVIFRELLTHARKINKNIKIYVMLMPIYKETWEHAKEGFLKWKEEFEEIIEGVKGDCDFTYIDWLQNELSEDRVYWYDVEHLNYYGAICFTEMLNKRIFH